MPLLVSNALMSEQGDNRCVDQLNDLGGGGMRFMQYSGLAQRSAKCVRTVLAAPAASVVGTIIDQGLWPVATRTTCWIMARGDCPNIVLWRKIWPMSAHFT